MFNSKVNAGASVLPIVGQGNPYFGVRGAGECLDSRWLLTRWVKGAEDANLTGNPSSQDDALKQALLAVVQLWEDRIQKQGVIVSPHFL